MSLASCVALAITLVGACAPSAASPAATVKPPVSAAPAAQAPAVQPPAAAAPREPRSLQVGFTGLSGFMYLYWAADHAGIFRELGLAPEKVQFNSPVDSMAAMASGSLEVSMGTTDTFLTALTKGAQTTLIADFVAEAPYELVARPETASVADLRGKKIGVAALRGGSATVARAMMRARGLTDDDYELTITGGNPQRYTALQAGGTDAAVLTDPVNFQARLDGYRVLLAFPDAVPGFAFSTWWIPRDTRGPEYQEAIVSYLAGLIRGREWAHAPENRERMIAVFMEEGRSPRPVAEQMYDYFMVQNPRMVDASDLRLGPVQTVAKLLQELEDLPALPPESQWVDRSYVERARQLAATRR